MSEQVSQFKYQYAYREWYDKSFILNAAQDSVLRDQSNIGKEQGEVLSIIWTADKVAD